MCSHFGGEGAGFSAPPTAAGFPTYYLEMRMARPQIAMAHTASLICEGVFEKFPNFRFLFIELDTFWVPGLMWHMDADWKSLRDYTPWVKRLQANICANTSASVPSPSPTCPTARTSKPTWTGSTPMRFLSSPATTPTGTGKNRAASCACSTKSCAPRVMYDTAAELYGLN